MRLSAVDCLLRGWSNTLANGELILAAWLQSVVVLVLVGAGFAVPLSSFGWTLDWDPRAPEGLLERLFGEPPPLSLQLGFELTAALALITLAGLVFSYFQAGLFALAHFADGRVLAPRASDYRSFRTFRWSQFWTWGGRLVWRFFWFYNLAGIFLSLALLPFAAWAGLTLFAVDRWGEWVAWIVGCVGALPVLALFLALGLGVGVGQADVVREDSGAWEATLTGFAILVRRPGAVLLLFTLFLAASLLLWALFVPLSLGVTFGLAGLPAASRVAQAGLTLVQMMPSAALNVILAASLVALVRSEGANRRRREVSIA